MTDEIVEPDDDKFVEQRKKYVIDHGPKYDALDILAPDSNAF